MQTARARNWAATCCVAVVISWAGWTALRVEAVADNKTGDTLQQETSAEVVTPLMEPLEPPVPIRADVKVRRYTVTEGADGLAAVSTETVSRGLAVSACHEDPDSVYCNTFGTALWGPTQANRRVSDDIVFAGDGGCDLDRYVIRVTGDKDQDGTGTALGGYTVTARLYTVCPSSSLVTPTPIPGTELIDFPVAAEQAGDIVEITKQVPAIQSVPLPAQLYLAVTFSRQKCGMVVGSPAAKGFSADQIDIPLAPCSGWFGGYPRSPHASIYAEIYTRGTCDSAYIGYRNSRQVEGPFSCGQGCRFADDVQLTVPGGECNLIGYEVAFRGAIVSVDLRNVLSDADPGGTTTRIPGTVGSCFPQTENQNEICRVDVDPPVQLDLANLWVTYRSGSSSLGPIRTCRDAQVGQTANFHRVYNEATRRWEDVLGAEEACWGGFDLTLYCEGPPTLGACCDMFVKECLGGDNDGAPCTNNNQCPGGRCEAACRDVPEQNCTSSLLGHPILWRPDTRCGAQCNGGLNDGLRCGGDDDCSICEGGTLDGMTCCPDGVCDNSQDNASCVGPGDPWPCCDGPGTGTCPWCVGGSRNDQPCCPSVPPNPPGQCAVATCEGPICEGGTNNGEVCSRAADCPGGVCTGGPFTRPCGLSACCLQQDDPQFPCQNLTQNQCSDRAGGPADRYQIGSYCGVSGQRCPINSCLNRQGNCFVPAPATCVGPDEGVDCDPVTGSPCRGVCRRLQDGDLAAAFRCAGGERDGELCCPSGVTTGSCGSAESEALCSGGTRDGLECCPGGTCTACTFSCPTGSVCARLLCDGGVRNGQTCDPDLEWCLGGTRDAELCCPAGECVNGTCVGGDLAGFECCPGDADAGVPAGTCAGPCPGGTCDRSLCAGSPGCADPFCCTNVCESLGDTFCCIVHWDDRCSEEALDVCRGGPSNDECFNPNDTTIKATPLPIPSLDFEAPAYLATEGNDPGLCCHEENPGGPATGGTLWFRFTAPLAPPGQTTSSVSLSTCDSRLVDEGPTGERTRYRAEDSLIGVFATANPDGGTCRDGTPCSVALQDCPTGACTLDERTACDNLIQIACNDDEPTCSDSSVSFPRRSALCVTGLIPGDPYWIMLAGKNRDSVDLPRQCSITGTPCTSVQTCDNEMEGQTCDLTNYCDRSFTSCIFNQQCPAGEQCINNRGISRLVLNTGLFQLTAMEGCTPERPRMLNDFCDDAFPIQQTGFCSINAGPCLVDSDCSQGETCEPLPVEFDLSGAVVGVCDGGTRDGQQCLVRFTGQCPDGQCRAQAPATFDCPGPPNQCAQFMQNEVWYQWTAPVDGNVEVDTCARVCLAGQDRGRTCTQDSDCGTGGDCGNPDTGLVVYEGCECPVDNNWIACSEFVTEAACLAGSRVSFNAVEGQCYLFRLAGNLGGLTNGRLTINERLCDAGTVDFLEAPDSTTDARQPHPPTNPFQTQGLRASVSEAPSGAEIDLNPLPTQATPMCWSFCETQDTGTANSFRSTVRNTDDTVTVRFTRAFTPNAVSTLTYEDYLGSSTTGVFYVHAGNVNGDEFADAADVADMIACCLEGNCDPVAMPLEQIPYRCDIDHSMDQGGSIAPADLLRTIDLLQGAELYSPGQMGTAKPSIDGCSPG